MNVPYSWLTELVKTDLPPERMAHALTMSGLEAERITAMGAEWTNVFVGEVLSVSPHPDADRLVLADVAAGEHRLTVVTGAPNIAQGQKVALALAGARLIDAHAEGIRYKTLKPGSIRGIRSEGMVCSEKELGLSEEHEGIMVLEDDAPVGAALRDWLGDTVIEFEITPNLVHAFSIRGIAREAAALTSAPLADLKTTDLGAAPASETLARIEAEDLCARYMAVVIDGVRVEPSPPWLARRLTAAGLRPVNNIVDVTNYVMLEVGQPLHAFDLEYVEGETISVRRSVPGETLETLDHQVRTLPEETLLITDASKPVAIAGVIGALNSEIVDSTTSILLESANFEMKSVRRTARALKLRTDASARFERGLDPELAGDGAARAARLILDLCPGASIRVVQDVYPSPSGTRSILFPVSRIERILGVSVDRDEMLAGLMRLGFGVTLDDSAGTLSVIVPTWRSDVRLPEDVIEEIARVVGYDALPATLPTGTTPAVERDATFAMERSVRQLMVAAGGYECRGYVTVSALEIERWGLTPEQGFAHAIDADSLVRLRNAIPADHDILRPSLIPGLVRSVSDNLKHERSVRLFEIGHVYLGAGVGRQPAEPSTLGIAFAGARHPFDRFGATGGDGDQLDFFDVKGVVETILRQHAVSTVTWKALSHPALHPGRSAAFEIDGQRAGVIGELRPDLARALEISDVRLTIAEIDLTRLLAASAGERARSVRVDRFLPVEQDFAVIVDRATSAADVREALLAGAGPLVTDVALFDVFEGSQLGEHKKSLAFRLTFTAPDRALTDAELAKGRKRIEKSLAQRVGGALRA